jgi:ABC-type taurine transport system substrate-binding protein
VSLILLDQNVPRAVSRLLTGHDARAAAELGWEELTNGDLLGAAESAGFAVIVTADQNIRYQQSLTGRRIAIIVLSTNHWPIALRRGVVDPGRLQKSHKVSIRT